MHPKRYPVQDHDLSALASVIGVDENDLVLFHNQHAPMSDIISDVIPDHVFHIFGPPLGYGLKDGQLFADPNKKQSKWIGQYEVLRNIGKGNRTYHLQLEMEILPSTELLADGGLELETNEISFKEKPYQKRNRNQRYYEVSGFKINSQNHPTMRLYSGGVYLDAQEPNGPLENLTMAIEKAISPVVLGFHYANIQNVCNHRQILQNWKEIRSSLVQELDSIYGQTIIDGADRYIYNKKQLLRQLEGDWFLSIYSLLLRAQFSGQDLYQSQIQLPIMPGCSPIGFEVVVEKYPFCNSNDKVQAIIKGKPNDLRSTEDILKKKSLSFASYGRLLKGNLNLTAIFDLQDQMLEQLFGNIRIDLIESYKTVTLELYATPNS
ncbi:MAG: hypothetical protein OIF50_08985 [Flavobacteriaceae bacterium]|nr:hypothetical protein [Flavobacteriaceae bacterium]